MAEYTEREALVQNKSICRSCFHSYVCEQFNEHRNSDNKKCHFFNDHFVSAADVVEVRHGEWVYYDCVSSHDGAKSGFACSVCSGFVEEDIFDMDEFNKAFCGACGAKMDGKGEGV